ncbi:hypothetical protein BJ166DRAFT_489670 [Pestalotiopsis sp. NC0098]|nr:hypothetical protein BJ166DRAFT_489670 [Pestalotiopsis sp. NC0098]
MSFLRGARLLLVVSSLVAAVPHANLKRDIETNCTDIRQRVPWTKLSQDEKLSYIEADLCLMNAPSKSGLAGAVTRWDDLQWPHITQTVTIHNVGGFLPFHRYYVNTHETLLRDECGYTGRLPYWDEVAEVANMSASDLFQEQYYGGNGAGGDSCITGGPFANLTLRFLADNQMADHCLSRQFDQFSFSAAAQNYINKCNTFTKYVLAWNCFTLAPHSAGHNGVGGIMSDPTFSPGDPLFFLHHAYLDKLWWEWQKLDYPARLYDMGGVNIPRTSDPDSPDYPPASLTDYFGDNGTITTLNHNLWMTGLVPNVTIGDIMNLNGPTICSEYLNAEDME